MPLPIFPTCKHEPRWVYRALIGMIIAALIGWIPSNGIAQPTGPLPADQSGEEDLGARIYRAQCLSCHGEDGQGGVQYEESLEGSLSLTELTQVVQETMPEDDPGSLDNQQASAVSRYVFDSFYSEAARARAQSPRVELSRLTAEQYRQAVIDLMDSFAGQAEAPGKERGLTGQYFAARKPHHPKTRKLERIDRSIEFDFGEEPPVEEIENPRRFAIRWSGSVYAPETGVYSFIIKSPQAIKFFLNSRQPQIDAWVKSEGENEHAVDVFLVGGRRYPIRLDFSKSKQGVDDSKKKKKKPPVKPASIQLQWKRPHGVAEIIPPRFLSPTGARVHLVCSTPFPPEDESYGWVRSSRISPEWDDATTAAALEVTEKVVDRLDAFVPGLAKADPEQQRHRLLQFGLEFARRAFRLTEPDELLRQRVESFFAGDIPSRDALKRVLLYTLKSPRFLFREVHDSAMANIPERLSFAVWNSLPDDRLLTWPRDASPITPEAVREQAQRMIEHPRAQHRLREFLLTWLQVDSERDINKDLTRYPGFDARAIADLRSSLELQIDEILNSSTSSYRELMTAERVYLNSRLAELFEVELEGGEGFYQVSLDPGLRAGVLTHPYILAQFAYRSESSPIHRGVFVARNVLGTRLNPPPEAVAPLSPELKPELTTRQRVALQTRPAQCMACHKTINALGFTFESFDAVGRYRETDRDQPVDTQVVFRRNGHEIPLENARQLAEMVVEDQQSQAAFCQQLFHFLAGQSINAYGQSTTEHLRQTFVKYDFNIRRLAEEILVVLGSHGHSLPSTSGNAPDDDSTARAQPATRSPSTVTPAGDRP